MIQDNIRASLPRPLTRRQHECVELVTEGLSSKEIARRLGIAPSTVDNHIAQVMHQCGIPNRATLRSYNLAARTLVNLDDQQSLTVSSNLDQNGIEDIAQDSPISVDKIVGLRNSILVFSGLSYLALAILIILSTLITAYMINLYRA